MEEQNKTTLNPSDLPSRPTPSPIPSSPEAPRTVKIQKRQLIFDKTQQALAALEKKLNGRVIYYYSMLSLNSDEVKYFYSHLKKIGYQKTLYFVINSHGGDGKSAYRIAHLLRNFCEELVVVVPEVAASAATMLSLSADKLLMSPLGYLTAVDTSLTHPLNPKGSDGRPVRIELEEVNRARDLILKDRMDETRIMEAYKTIFSYIHPVSLGAMERSSSLSEMLCMEILELRREKMSLEQSTSLVRKLNREYPAHGYPINRIKARELGLNVLDTDRETDDLLFNLQNLYRYLSDEVRTDFSDSFYHVEAFWTILETVGFRTVNWGVLERKIDPVIKSWTVVKDVYKWQGVFEGEQDGKKMVLITTLDL